MKIRAKFIVYDYRSEPKRYRVQITHRANSSLDALSQLAVVLVSRLSQKLNCDKKEIANVEGDRVLDPPILYRMTSYEILDYPEAPF